MGNSRYFLVSQAMSPLLVRSKVCMAPFPVRNESAWCRAKSTNFLSTWMTVKVTVTVMVFIVRDDNDDEDDNKNEEHEEKKVFVLDFLGFLCTFY